MNDFAASGAIEIAAAIKAGRASAKEIVVATLDRIERLNPKLGAFTDVVAERALQKAAAIRSSARRRQEPLARSPARRSR